MDRANRRRCRAGNAFGAAWILERLRACKDEHDAAHAGAPPGLRFAPLADSLQQALSSWQLTPHIHEPIVPDGAARVLGMRLADLTGELESRLASVHDIADQSPAHRVCIAAKHLRYALEPIAELAPDSVPLVGRLRGLQDTVGDMHDAHLLAAFVADGMEEAAHAPWGIAWPPWFARARRSRACVPPLRPAATRAPACSNSRVACTSAANRCSPRSPPNG